MYKEMRWDSMSVIFYEQIHGSDVVFIRGDLMVGSCSCPHNLCLLSTLFVYDIILFLARLFIVFCIYVSDVFLKKVLHNDRSLHRIHYYVLRFTGSPKLWQE